MTAVASSSLTPSSTGAPLFRVTPWHALFAGLLFAPFLLVSCVAKALKYAALSEEGALLEAIAVLGPDLGVVGLLVLSGTVLLSVRSRLVSGPIEGALHLLAPLLAAAAVFEHGFFSLTGVLVDAHIVLEHGRQLSQVKGVIFSELTPLRSFGLLLPFAASLGLFMFTRAPLGKRLRAWLDAPPSWRRAWRALGVASALFLLLALGPGSMSLPAHVEPLGQSVTWALGRDLVAVALERGSGESSLEVEPLAPVRWQRRRPAKAKNVVTLVLESTGAKRTSAYTPSLGNTPFLEQLAKRGALVEEAYTVVPHTTKALISIHCGVYPKLTPKTEEASAAGIPTRCLPELLREAGFSTAFFQAAEENYERRQDLVRRFGFAKFAGKESIDGSGFDEASYFGWEDDALLGPVLEWVDGQQDQFYLSVLTLVAHHPYNVPKGFVRERRSDDHELDDYLNTVAYTDRFLQKLFAAFQERGLLEDTLFVIVGDHGEGFGEHGRKQHDTVLYEEGIHVPMLLVGAGVEAGTRVRGPRQAIDVLPTVLGHLGYEPQSAVLGRSLLTDPPHEQLFFSCHYRDYCLGLRRGSMKYLYNYKKRGPEVFNLAADPLEQNNIYGEVGAFTSEMDEAIIEMERIRAQNLAQYDAQQTAVTELFVKKERPKVIPRPLDVDFEGAVKLIGWDMDREDLLAGQKVIISLYYEVLKELPSTWRAFLHLRGPRFINADHAPVEGAYPMSDWSPGDFIVDRHTITTRPLFPAGEYDITTGFWEKEGRIVPEGTGAIIGADKAVSLGTLRIDKPALAVAEHVPTVRPAEPATLDLSFGELARVHDVAVDRPQVKGGLKTTLFVTYEVLRDPGEGLSFEVLLEGPSRKPRLPHVPLNGALPLSAWRAGQFIRDPVEVVTHTKDVLGDYTVKLRLVNEAGEAVPVRQDGALVPGGAAALGGYTVVR
jgi:lipoteichoic acid synthase